MKRRNHGLRKAYISRLETITSPISGFCCQCHTPIRKRPTKSQLTTASSSWPALTNLAAELWNNYIMGFLKGIAPSVVYWLVKDINVFDNKLDQKSKETVYNRF